MKPHLSLNLCQTQLDSQAHITGVMTEQWLPLKFSPFDLLPGQAADMTLVWLWTGEPYAGVGVRDHRYSLQF